MANAAQNKDIDDLKAQIDALKADISALTGTVRDIGKNRAEALRSAASEQAGAWREQGEAAMQQAREKGIHAYGTAEQSVRDNPAMAVGIAAGIGFLAGLVFGRK